jgi:hypothetical protein
MRILNVSTVFNSYSASSVQHAVYHNARADAPPALLPAHRTFNGQKLPLLDV